MCLLLYNKIEKEVALFYIIKKKRILVTKIVLLLFRFNKKSCLLKVLCKRNKINTEKLSI